MDRLDLENKSMKDPSVESGGQSLGNIACSQELEHLHKVVDKLKSTVLQQRSYLLQLSMYLCLYEVFIFVLYTCLKVYLLFSYVFIIFIA